MQFVAMVWFCYVNMLSEHFPLLGIEILSYNIPEIGSVFRQKQGGRWNTFLFLFPEDRDSQSP
jgi:hypothetical protein